MLAAVRSASRRFLACVLIVFTFVGTSGAWHVPGDDPDCTDVVIHDHSAHHPRLARATVSDAPVHCAICHWLQTFRTDPPPNTRIAFDESAAAPVVSTSQHVVELLGRLDVPSRAPPAA